MLADFARHLIGLLERGERAGLLAVFAAVERLHVAGEHYVLEATTVARDEAPRPQHGILKLSLPPGRNLPAWRWPAWFRENLTTPTAEVWAKLNSKLRGLYQYYGVNDNWPWLLKYRRVAVQMGLRWLRRRSQAATMSRAAYRMYLTRHEIASPKKIVDLIAMAR